MDKTASITVAAVAALLSASCGMQGPDSPASREIVLGVGGGFSADVVTRAAAVTAVPSTLYWGATTGASGNETVKWAAASASVTDGKVSTGKFQTVPPTAYSYYAANAPFTVPTSAGHVTMAVAGNSVDIVAGRAALQTGVSPSLTLGHVFARTGTFSMTVADPAYSVTVLSWRIAGKSDVNGTAGTYDLTSGAWTAASAKLASAVAVTSSSDLYLIPGTYTVSCTFRLMRGDWMMEYTKSADVDLVGGKVNNVNGRLEGGEAIEITLDVSVAPWGTEDHSPSFT